MNAEHTGQHPTAEQKFGKERLSHESLRREVAKAAILAILIARLSEQDISHLFAMLKQKDSKTPGGDLLGLIDATSSSHNRGNRAKRPKNNPQTGWFSTNEWQQQGHAGEHRASKRARSESPFAPRPEFRPAPSMSTTEQGPQLPNLAFNDRIRPWDRQPSNEDFASAARANEMYRGALWETGWRGGEATPDQHKTARRSMVKNFSPDMPETSDADKEAFKIYNADRGYKEQMAKERAKESAAQGEPEPEPQATYTETAKPTPQEAYSEPEASTPAPGPEEPEQAAPREPMALPAVPSAEAPEHTGDDESNGT